MAARRGGLGDGKGGDLLASLQARLSPPTAKPVAASKEDLAMALARRARRLTDSSTKVGHSEPMSGKKSKKEIVKLPRAFAIAALAPFRSGPVAVSAASAARAYDFGEAAFRKLAAMRDRLDAFVATHDASAAVSDMTASRVARFVATGAAQAEACVDPNDGYFLGYDFGTSTTKVVLRDPYRRGSAFALPVPRDMARGEQPHLWPSVVFLDAASRFHLCPGPGLTLLAGFKSALIERRGHRMCGPGVTMAEAATAFLAIHLAYAFGALLSRDAEARIAGVNLSVPVAALADVEARADFDRVARAALLLVPDANRLTLDHVRVALALEDASPIPLEPHAELSGAIAGYCAQPRRFAGAHMIVDCGSATLDIASFQLGSEGGPIGIHAALVERLGADACSLYRREGAALDECRDAARHQEHRVFCATLDRMRAGFSQDEGRRYPYQVILIGGGIGGEVHAPLFDGMARAFNRPFHRPAIGLDLHHEPGADPVRLVLADGLARDPIDLRDVAMPGDRATPAAAARPNMISKDQV